MPRLYRTSQHAEAVFASLAPRWLRKKRAMKHSVGLVSVTLLGWVLGGGILSAQPKITIAPSPNPRVTIVSIEASGSAPAAAFLSGTFPNLQQASFFLDNQSGRSIMAIVVLGVASGPGLGKPRTTRMMLEGFQNALLQPVLTPGSRLLVVPPSDLILEKYISRRLDIASASGKPPFQSAVNWFGTASEVSISIDSIVFASGEVDGPDTEHFMQELTSRKQAADSVVAAIGAGDSAALSAMEEQPIQAGDNHLSEWESRFARHYLSSKDPAVQAAVKQELQGYPVPPPLFRGSITSN